MGMNQMNQQNYDYESYNQYRNNNSKERNVTQFGTEDLNNKLTKLQIEQQSLQNFMS